MSELFNPPELAAPAGFSHAVRAGDTVYLAGQVAMASDGTIVGADMKAGDCLFFDGKTIHGSYPNTTPDRFRRPGATCCRRRARRVVPWFSTLPAPFPTSYRGTC